MTEMTNEQNDERINNPGDDVTQEPVNGADNNSAYEYSDEVCAEFQAHIAERMEAGEDLAEDPHLKTCSRCSALISDLEAIAKAAFDYMKMEEAEPSESLWDKIESAIKGGDAPNELHSDLPANLALESGTA